MRRVRQEMSEALWREHRGLLLSFKREAHLATRRFFDRFFPELQAKLVPRSEDKTVQREMFPSHGALLEELFQGRDQVWTQLVRRAGRLRPFDGRVLCHCALLTNLQQQLTSITKTACCIQKYTAGREVK